MEKLQLEKFAASSSSGLDLIGDLYQVLLGIENGLWNVKMSHDIDLIKKKHSNLQHKNLKIIQKYSHTFKDLTYCLI